MSKETTPLIALLIAAIILPTAACFEISVAIFSKFTGSFALLCLLGAAFAEWPERAKKTSRERR